MTIVPLNSRQHYFVQLLFINGTIYSTVLFTHEDNATVVYSRHTVKSQ